MTMVSEAQRKANAKAVERRNKWRRDYKLLSEAISYNKGLRSLNYQAGAINFANEISIVLRSLQETADIMMEYRFNIKQELKETAYQYV